MISSTALSAPGGASAGAPVVTSYQFAVLPQAPLPGVFNRTRGRREVQELTGNRWVPTLVLDDGTVIDDSHAIIDWAAAHPA